MFGVFIFFSSVLLDIAIEESVTVIRIMLGKCTRILNMLNVRSMFM